MARRAPLLVKAMLVVLAVAWLLTLQKLMTFMERQLPEPQRPEIKKVHRSINSDTPQPPDGVNTSTVVVASLTNNIHISKVTHEKEHKKNSQHQHHKHEHEQKHRHVNHHPEEHHHQQKHQHQHHHESLPKHQVDHIHKMHNQSQEPKNSTLVLPVTSTTSPNTPQHLPSTLPGLVWEQRLWLLGARITRSYDSDDLALTVFGMPGDFHNRTKSSRIRCPATSWYNNINGTILSYDSTRHVHLYASFPERPTRLIPLEFMPSVSGDYNQNRNTLIWHGSLKEYLQVPLPTNGDMSLRVTFHASFAQKEESPSPIVTIDIPLSTGLVGQAGPHVLGSSQIPSSPDGVTLCVAIYGSQTLQFLPEFIIHHTKIGFGPIVIGLMDATVESSELKRAKEYLQDFIDQGLVDLSVMDLVSPLQPPLECEVNVRKQHFYSTCLYYAKGKTPYMGIWDIDEYWLPPPKTTTTTNSTLLTENTTMIDPTNNNQSSTSIYSQSMNIRQVMEQVENYHDSYNCSQSWCYFAFPSWNVMLRRNSTHHIISRTGTIVSDFEQRESEIEWEWSKSVTRTKYAYMGGLHQTGSCRFPTMSTGQFMPRHEVLRSLKPYTPVHTACRNIGMDGFGGIHHFNSLHRLRTSEEKGYRGVCLGEPGYNDDDDEEEETTGADAANDVNPTDPCVLDEYVQHYAPTVQRLVDARRAANPSLPA